MAEQIRNDKNLCGEMSKSDNSPVTLADFAVQYIVVQKLKEQFPNWPIIAEEDSSILTHDFIEKLSMILGKFDVRSMSSVCDGKNPPEYFWALDPIDGTRGFLIEGGQYCVCLSLLKRIERSEEYDPIIGVLGCPLLKGGMILDSCSEILTNVKNSVDRVPLTLENLRITIPRVRSGRAELNIRVKEVIPMDSQCKYALLVLNMADVYYRSSGSFPDGYQEKIWDHAAGTAILRAHGGEVWDMNGCKLKFLFSPFLKCPGGILAGKEGTDVFDLFLNTNKK
jgi:3'(2'), 5'-bisphosphate nucleotidase